MKTLQYVLDNLIEAKQCRLCSGVWFLFNHEGKEAYYRLSPLAPHDCSICKPIDEQIEAESIVSIERWITL